MGFEGALPFSIHSEHPHFIEPIEWYKGLRVAGHTENTTIIINRYLIDLSILDAAHRSET